MNSTLVLSEVETLRVQARRYIEERAATSGYSASHAEVLRLLNEASAAGMVRVPRYGLRHWPAHGSDAQSTGDECLAHSNGRQGQAACAAGGSLLEVVSKDLKAEQIAIDSYREAMRSLDGQDTGASKR